MTDYFSSVAAQIGIPVWTLAVIFIWSFVWKLLALWKSARRSSPIWFVLLAVINTVGILEILYIYVFSEIKPNQKKSKPVRKKSKRKKKK